MKENPYEPPQVIMESTAARGRLPLWVLSMGRQLVTIVVVTTAGLAGIIGGCVMLVEIAPDIRDSDYFMGAIAICGTIGGLLVAVAANLGLNWIIPRTRFWFHSDAPRVD